MVYNAVTTLFLIKHRVGVGIIIHFHLPIHLHIDFSCSNICQSLINRQTQILLLFEQNLQFSFAFCNMFRSSILS